MVILIYIQNMPLERHQIVALYRTQGAVRRTTHLIYIQNVPFGRRALCRKLASMAVYVYWRRPDNTYMYIIVKYQGDVTVML